MTRSCVTQPALLLPQHHFAIQNNPKSTTNDNKKGRF
ncbi:MAG: hypothetical protein K0R82_2353 [Flavipsychrobacter sp.]|nr:hypothetical protein [Flavipsychrobacter sp.]